MTGNEATRPARERRYAFLLADVFTDRIFAGNPLAILPEADGLTTRDMQRIAAEMNLSETVFVLPPRNPQALCRLRIFTPREELPLAGHPVVGSFFVLASRGALGLDRALREVGTGNHRVHQECGAGVLPVDIRVKEGRVEQVVMTQAPPRFLKESIDRRALSGCLGLEEGDVLPGDLPAQVVSTAVPQLMAPVDSLAGMERIRMDAAALETFLAPLGAHCLMAFTRECVHPGSTAHARMFAPGLGVHEDPATGSAAGALGAWLVRHRLVVTDRNPAQLTIEQGHEMGRPGTIRVEVVHKGGNPVRVLVGGQAVEVAEGAIRVP